MITVITTVVAVVCKCWTSSHKGEWTCYVAAKCPQTIPHQLPVMGCSHFSPSQDLYIHQKHAEKSWRVSAPLYFYPSSLVCYVIENIWPICFTLVGLLKTTLCSLGDAYLLNVSKSFRFVLINIKLWVAETYTHFISNAVVTSIM
jgi:hypothetical protein